MTPVLAPGASVEQQVRDIISEVRAASKTGALTPQMLSVAIAAMQDFITYLERLEVAPLEATDAGTAGNAAAEFITERMWNYER